MFDQKIYSPTMAQQNGEVVSADTVKKTGRNLDLSLHDRGREASHGGFAISLLPEVALLFHR